MRRLVGFAFDYEEPVRGGYLRLGDVTVLTSRNDTGKTRLLGLIESTLMNSGSVQGVDVFGLASEIEVDELVDREAPDRGSTGECAETLGPFDRPVPAPPSPRRVPHVSQDDRP